MGERHGLLCLSAARHYSCRSHPFVKLQGLPRDPSCAGEERAPLLVLLGDVPGGQGALLSCLESRRAYESLAEPRLPVFSKYRHGLRGLTAAHSQPKRPECGYHLRSTAWGSCPSVPLPLQLQRHSSMASSGGTGSGCTGAWCCAAIACRTPPRAVTCTGLLRWSE